MCVNFQRELEADRKLKEEMQAVMRKAREDEERQARQEAVSSVIVIHVVKLFY